MANTYKNILIVPALPPDHDTVDPYISFRGANTTANTEIHVHIYANNNGTLSFEGSDGSILAISDNVSNAVATTGVFTAFGNSTLTGPVTMHNTANIAGAVNALSNVGVSGTLSALGQLAVTGNANFNNGTLFIDAVNNCIGIGNTTPAHALRVEGQASITGNLTVVGTLIGNTEGTANNATNLNGQPATYYTNASNLSTGTVAIARLDANVILTTSTTGINASAISTGSLAYARLATTTAGRLLMGNATGGIEGLAMSGDITITSAGVTAIGSGVVVDADISASAAIAHSKLATTTAGNLLMGNATNGIQGIAMSGDVTITGAGVTAIGSGKVTSAMIADGTIVNGDISASAAIAYSKLSLSGSIVNGDINASAAIAHSKLATTTAGNLLMGNATSGIQGIAMSGDITITSAGVTAIGSGKVTSAMIADGTIVNGDISASAAIAVSKLAASTISGVTLGNNLNAVTFNNSGSGAASGSTYNGSGAITVSYNTVGAPSTGGSGASGTWSINVTGSAGSATYATSAGNATTAGGLAVHAGRNNEANKIVRTDGSGYMQTGYINSSNGDENNASNPARVWGTNGSDSYMRTYQTGSLSVGYAGSAGYASSSGYASTAGGYSGGGIILNGASPTIYLQDTDHRSSMIHCNSNVWYVLRGSGVNSQAWAAYNGYWPLTIELENNNATFGGALTAVGAKSFRIRHPLSALRDTLDLIHYATEGPRADLLYRGRAELVDGIARISLDAESHMHQGTLVLLAKNFDVFAQMTTGWTPVRGYVDADGYLNLEAQNPVSGTATWLVIGQRQDPSIQDSIDADGHYITERVQFKPNPGVPNIVG